MTWASARPCRPWPISDGRAAGRPARPSRRRWSCAPPASCRNWAARGRALRPQSLRALAAARPRPQATRFGAIAASMTWWSFPPTRCWRATRPRSGGPGLARADPRRGADRQESPRHDHGADRAPTLTARTSGICLTGTPLENHLGRALGPVRLPDAGLPGRPRRIFGRRFRGPIEKGGDADRQAALARRVAPFLLRRTKARGRVRPAAAAPRSPEAVQMVRCRSARVYDGASASPCTRRVQRRHRRKAVWPARASSSSTRCSSCGRSCCDPRLLKTRRRRARRKPAPPSSSG